MIDYKKFKFVSLISDGLDSPVASFLTIKKGYSPIYLSFLTEKDFENEMKQKITKIINRISNLTNSGYIIYFINHTKSLDFFKSHFDRKLTCILCKRTMLRTAKRIGEIENTKIIVTGDILGEQASQTLDNLFAFNDITKNSIMLRPLIGWNKLDVIDLNKKIGLYDICSQSIASCSYAPKYPETHAKLFEIEKIEKKIDFEIFIKESIKQASILRA
ncbi:MAG: hypothetical protein GF353_28125 [Candidatus Lokiarchaeota archaeon]|nr:hypothetical protein [Candidatus Lokiarchaeota archaeon]